MDGWAAISGRVVLDISYCDTGSISAGNVESRQLTSGNTLADDYLRHNIEELAVGQRVRCLNVNVTVSAINYTDLNPVHTSNNVEATFHFVDI